MASAKYGSTLGALLLGAVLAVFLSGIVAMQVFVYYRLYPNDQRRNKIAVGVVWILDLAHSAMICIANWSYLIDNFGDGEAAKAIAWPISTTIVLTAIITFIVHCFFTFRVFSLSKRKYYIAGPIGILACLRVVSAMSCTSQMVRAGTWAKFNHDSAWLFTSGLSISAALDVMIASCLIYYLQKSRTGWKIMDAIIKIIVLYTIESGLLTSICAVVSLICWVTMSYNLIFLALHFAIAKLYANSFLASLNARKQLQQRSHGSSDHQLSVLFPTSPRGARFSRSVNVNPLESMQISVEKTVHCVTDGDVTPIQFTTSRDTRSQGEQ